MTGTCTLTLAVSKFFERLIKYYICSVVPASLDPLQFAYCSNRSTDTVFILHNTLFHWTKRTHVKMLFVDYHCLQALYETLTLSYSQCSWVLDFLSGKCQVVKIGSNMSILLNLNTPYPHMTGWPKTAPKFNEKTTHPNKLVQGKPLLSQHQPKDRGACIGL